MRVFARCGTGSNSAERVSAETPAHFQIESNRVCIAFAYNKKLSEARGRTVRDWLGADGAIPASTPIKAFGKRVPIAPNTTLDGRDDPEGRQKNRRVEIVFETCKS
jgi:hypothetical protein